MAFLCGTDGHDSPKGLWEPSGGRLGGQIGPKLGLSWLQVGPKTPQGRPKRGPGAVPERAWSGPGGPRGARRPPGGLQRPIWAVLGPTWASFSGILGGQRQDKTRPEGDMTREDRTRRQRPARAKLLYMILQTVKRSFESTKAAATSPETNLLRAFNARVHSSI